MGLDQLLVELIDERLQLVIGEVDLKEQGRVHLEATVMQVHPAEYWQLLVMVAGLPFLWIASKAGTDFTMILAGIVVAAGIFATIYVKKRILGPWQRFRAPTGKP